MNSKEDASGKVFKNWTDIVPTVRKELNKIRAVDIDVLKKEHEKNPQFVETTKSSIVKKKMAKK